MHFFIFLIYLVVGLDSGGEGESEVPDVGLVFFLFGFDKVFAVGESGGE